MGGFKMSVTIQLPNAHGKKLQDIVAYLKSHADALQITEIWLFGSMARGTYNTDSDIDIMVIVESNPRSVRLALEEAAAFDKTFPDVDTYPEVDITVRTLEMLDDKAFVFNDLVKKDKIVLWKKRK